MSREAIPVDEFVLGDGSPQMPAVWGDGDRIAWASGEPLMIYGPEGVGKSTIAQQLALSLAGIRPPTFLGMTVRPCAGRVLYLALDRPKQIRRSLARMADWEISPSGSERLYIRHGALGIDLVEDPAGLWLLAEAEGATTVIVDSLKDILPDLSKDESGNAFQWAAGHVIDAGIELLVLHHPTKSVTGKSLADSYGSRWLTAATGSVLSISGTPGASTVKLNHLKQPIEDIGTLNLWHDHRRGITTLRGSGDLSAIRATHGPLVAKEAAGLQFGDTSPDAVERARRALEKLVPLVAVRQPRDGGMVEYRLVDGEET